MHGAAWRVLFISLVLGPSLVACGGDSRGQTAGEGGSSDSGRSPGDGSGASTADSGCPLACSDTAASALPDPTLPHNVIIVMGDGMGPAHLEAARAFSGEALVVDGMLGPALYETTSVGGAVTDSAASATALATGHCTLNGVLGLAPDGARLETLLELSRQRGKRTGLVTNSYILDASPMAFAVHVPDRGLGGAIAGELTAEAKVDLVMGGWIAPEALLPQESLETLAAAAGYDVGHVLSEFDGLSQSARLFGLFGRGPSAPEWPAWEWGLTPEVLRPPSSDEPTLSEMAARALAHLRGAPEGFFLFVESELVDTIGHASNADPILAASLIPPVVLELDRAVSTVLAWVRAESSFDDTLVLVVSDHETGGYAAPSDDPLAGTFSTTDHTDRSVPAYALGPGAQALGLVRHVSDLHALVTQTLPEAGEPTCR